MDKYYVVIDLEMCQVPKVNTEIYNFKLETIQIGAVLLNDSFDIVDEFSTYVKPQYGYIDSFIEELTGINEKMVENAPIFESAIKNFKAWLPEGDVYGVSWSLTDSQQIRKEMKNKGIEDEYLLNMVNKKWIDCQAKFGKKVSAYRNVALDQALNIADIMPKGTAHDGLNDAYNTAVLFRKLNVEKEFKVHPAYQNCLNNKEEHLSVSLSDMLEKIKLQVK